MRARLIKFIILIGIIGWVSYYVISADQQIANLQLRWGAWQIETHPGLVLLGLFLLALIGIKLRALISALRALPEKWRHRKDRASFTKGAAYLQQAIAALQGQNPKRLRQKTELATGQLGERFGIITTWLNGKIALLNGEQKRAQQLWQDLANHNENANDQKLAAQQLAFYELSTLAMAEMEQTTSQDAPPPDKLDHLQQLDEMAKDIIRSCPDDSHALSWLAQRASGQHDYEKARTWLDLLAEAALAHHAKYPTATRQSIKKQYDFQKADLLYQQAQSYFPNLSEIAYHDDKDKLAAAKDLLRSALKLAPDHQQAALLLASLLGHAGEKKAARRVVYDLWTQAPSHKAGLLFEQLCDEGQTDAARYLQIEKLANYNKASPHSLLLLARAALKANMTAQAANILAPLEKSPDKLSPAIRLELALILGDMALQKNDPQSAHDQWRAGLILAADITSNNKGQS